MAPKNQITLIEHHKRLERLLQAIALFSVSVGYASNKTRPPVHSNTFIQKLRQFLHYLCFICDSRRGGDTVTAMVVEETTSGYILWVSQNKPEPSTVLSHLQAVFAMLQQPGQTPTENYQKLGLITASYSEKRIIQTRDLALIHLNKVVHILRHNDKMAGSLESLLSHLATTESSEFFATCRCLYEMRKESPMTILKSESEQHHGSVLQKHARDAYHYIGRLIEQYRAVKTLVDLRNDVLQFFGDSDIRFVPVLEPQAWGSLITPYSKPLTIDNVLRKHFSKDERLKQAINVLQHHQDKLQLFDSFLGGYREFKTCKKPVVHCEMSLATDLSRRKAQFALKDRFISTSKPYCLMCSYFLKHHPGRFAEGPSSGNLWPSWSLPLIGQEDQKQLVDFRRLIVEVIQDMRRRIEVWIDDPSIASDRGADSLTNITESVILDCVMDQSLDTESVSSCSAASFILAPELSKWKNSVLPLPSETTVESQDIHSHSDSDSDDGGVLLFSGRH